MSKSIWHTGKEIPDEDRYIVVKNKVGLYSVGSEFEYDLDRVEKWAYFDDFLALETELDRTRKALEAIRLHLMAAKGRFNFYDECLVSGIDTPHARFIKEEIENALEQITTLEQKDK